jgi:hypothetical protein
LRSRCILAAGAIAALILSTLPAAADPCSPDPFDCGNSEVIPVEALGATSVLIPELGPMPTPLVAAVRRPETICGNPGGSSTTLVDCYEFAMTYVSYEENGTQILHLPEANAVPFDDPSCELPSNDRSPSPIKAPVCGELRVELLPLNQQSIAFFQTPSARWDGVSRNPGLALWTRTEEILDRSTYALPKIRIPAQAVYAGLPQTDGTLPGYTLALIRATHVPLFGFRSEVGLFSPLKRTVVWSETLGNLHDALSYPVLFAPPADS